MYKRQCTITGNVVTQSFVSGAGIAVDSAEPLIEGCLIAGNVCSGSFSDAAGVHTLFSPSPTLRNCTIAGNQTNYAIGRRVGQRAFQWEQSRWFNRRAFDQAHAFYEKYGGVTLVVGRFMPFVRTFAPFVAGVAAMTRRRFTFFDVTGGALWVGSLVTAGYLFGNVPWVQQNLSKIIWAMILIPGVVVLFGAWKARRKAAAA